MFKYPFVVYILLVFSILPKGICAQVFNGVVVDQVSNEALPYVNIALLESHIGTVSKFDGTFYLDLTEIAQLKDSIAFSIIGYSRKVVSVAQLYENPSVQLRPISVNLESVIVSPRTPEEYIRLAIENIPENYINQPFNGTIYNRTTIRINGIVLESSEAIIKGYIMPVVGKFQDSTRLQMLCFKQFDEEEKAINSVRHKKNKEKMAIKGLDSILLSLNGLLSENFDIYTQIDSNMVKMVYEKGYNIMDEKYWFENMVQYEDRNLMRIGFSQKIKMAKQKGNILLDEESLAFESYAYEIGTSSLKLKMLLWVFGIGFKSATAVVQFTSTPSPEGWIPDLLEVNAFVDMEENRWFAKDIPIVIEINSHMRFLEIEVPAVDLCNQGNIIKKKKPLKEQFEHDPSNHYWFKYREAIQKEQNGKF